MREPGIDFLLAIGEAGNGASQSTMARTDSSQGRSIELRHVPPLDPNDWPPALGEVGRGGSVAAPRGSLHKPPRQGTCGAQKNARPAGPGALPRPARTGRTTV